LAGAVAEELLRIHSGLLLQGEAMKAYAMRTPSYLPIYQAGIRSMVAVPLVSRDRIVGTLVLGSLQADAYSEKDLKLAEKIGTQIAGAIANVQLFREYRRTWGDLRKSEERYRRLVENSPLGILAVDRKGIITHINTQMASILGFPLASATQRISIFSFSPLRESGVSAKFRSCMDSGEPGVLEGIYHGQEGDERHLRYHFTPIRDSEEKITGVQAVVEDVSERKHLEDQLAQAQKMEAIGTLAGGIAHDFNNILSAIMGYTELAGLDTPEGSKVRYNLEQSLKASQRAKSLIQQILAFSRQSKPERKPIDIGPIIKEGLKLLRASLPSTIEIRQDLGRDLGSVVADPTQIHQVVMNLCTNAGHAMGAKGGILEVSLGKIDMEGGAVGSAMGIEAGAYLRLRVSDTGHGISAQILKRIFDPYFTTKGAGKGTGLGLAVVHGIVKSYGGGIVVSSEVGKGSTFDVYLPRIESPSSVLQAEKVEPLPLGEYERILFVDDEKEVGEIGRKTLEYLGYEVVVRTSSLEALELFRAKADQFDLVITDMTMPNMTGEGLAREILGIRPGMPIILCTGFSEHMSGEKAKALGIREFVMKPLVMVDLAKAIRKALDSRKKKKGGE
jgi:PAS domain S-box-containing protein